LENVKNIHNYINISNNPDGEYLGRKSSFSWLKEINNNTIGKCKTNFKLNTNFAFNNTKNSLFEEKYIATKKVKIRKINTFVNFSSLLESDLFLDNSPLNFPNNKLKNFDEIFNCKIYYKNYIN